jgi:SSS family solute:Na+ symporter
MPGPDYTLAPIDLAIVVVYAAIVVVKGVWLSRRRDDTPEGYFLAGRSLVWPLIGLSLFASNISSTTLVGLAGDAYATGISVFNYEWMAALVLAFYAVFMLPQVLRSRVFTMPEFLERRFDGRVRTGFSLLTLFLNVVVDMAGSLYAGAVILKLVYPEVPVWQSVAVLAVLAGLYTAMAGLRAVIWTDAVQAVLLLTGSIVIAVEAYSRVGGWRAVLEAVPAEKLSLIRPIGDPGVPWPGLLLGVTLLGFYFWCTNQFMAQRILAARNVDHARWGSLFAGLLKLPVLFLMVLPGTFALILYPHLGESPDLVYPTLMFDLLPTGLLGLVFAGFVAALMSQVDSTLNSASTLVTMDFVARRRPDLEPRRLKRIGQVVTLGFMVLAAAWAPQIERFSSLFKYLQAVLAYTVSPVAALFLVGLFWRRANADGAFLGFVGGLAAGFALFLANVVFDLIDLHFLYAAPLTFAISALLVVAGSLTLGPAPGPDADALVFSRSAWIAESREARLRSSWKDYRLQAGALLLVTALLVVAFW